MDSIEPGKAVNQNRRRQVYHWFENALSRLLITQCRLCRERVSDNHEICDRCRRALPWLTPACRRCALPLPHKTDGVCGACLRRPPPFDATLAPWRYEAAVARLIHRFKFHADLAAGRLLADLLAETLTDRGDWATPALVPVPLHPGRLRQRGFNQAGEIARRLPGVVHGNLLHRTTATAAQRGLDIRSRRRNVRGAFALTGHPVPERVVIVDDVVTTGATVAALATLLRRGGAKEILVCALARVVKG